MRLGPGAMVAAAFVGPGTVATTTAAGAVAGASLLWAVLFSVFTTVVLQELAIRSALVSGRDLATLVRDLGEHRWWSWPLLGLVVCAVGIGNAAYEAGNITGAVVGLTSLLPVSPAVITLAIGLVAGALLLQGDYEPLQRVLVVMVGAMATVFVGLALFLLPDFLALPQKTSSAGTDAEYLTLSIALIGTTVVPYNLFLHASAVRLHWQGVPTEEALKDARRESLASISIGGSVTTALVIVAATLIPASSSAEALPRLMEQLAIRYPLAGPWLLGLGIFAAGLTSAIAAPLAAGWAVSGALGWSTDTRARGFRAIALGVLLVGVGFALAAARPGALIIGAQATNGLLLPIIAGTLLAVANQRKLLGEYRNTLSANLMSGAAVSVVTGLALYKLWGLMAG